MRISRFLPIILAIAAACNTDGGPSGPPPIVGATRISAGWGGGCALGSSGGMACWGVAPAGTEADTGDGVDLLGAKTIPTPIEFTSIFLSSDGELGTGCAVGVDAQAYCWGTLYGADISTPHSIGNGIQPLAGFGSMSSVAVGRFVLCGARTDRGVRCVGWYDGGGRGNDSIPDPDAFDLTPTGLKPATQAFGTAIGERFGCAIRTDSLVACWGRRTAGRLGGAAGDTLADCGVFAATACQPGPATVVGGVKYRQVSIGDLTACAVRIDGGVDCWGVKKGVMSFNLTGLTCDPVDACNLTPTAMALPASATRVGVGRLHACALLTSGDVYCWGDNSDGQLGRPGASSLTPVKVSGGYEFSALSVGAYFSCAIEAESGAVGCWGNNLLGQLGDGTTENRDHPVPVVAAE